MNRTPDTATKPAPPKGLAILFALLALTTLIINGCAVKQPVPRPQYPQKPPVRSQPVKVVPPSYPAQRIPTPPPVELPPQETPTVYQPKIGSGGPLYASAKEAINNGNYQQAEMALERALKIEPRNAHYWYTMAQTKFEQKQYAQTVHLCSKSKSLAGKNTQLLRLNDELQAKAEQRLGN